MALHSPECARAFFCCCCTRLDITNPPQRHITMNLQSETCTIQCQTSNYFYRIVGQRRTKSQGSKVSRAHETGWKRHRFTIGLRLSAFKPESPVCGLSVSLGGKKLNKTQTKREQFSASSIYWQKCKHCCFPLRIFQQNPKQLRSLAWGCFLAGSPPGRKSSCARIPCEMFFYII